MTSVVSFASFIGFHSSSNGGVFSLNNITLSIKCCYFSDDSAQIYGGCFYFMNSDLNMSKCSFESCYSSSTENDIGGNVLHFDTGVLYLS